jgi:hypothetical protein
VDNDTLDSMDDFERTLIAALQWLCGLAPAAVEDGVGRGNAGRRRRILAAHDPDEDVDGGFRVAPGQRTNLCEGFCHLRFAAFRLDILARRGIDVIPGEIVYDRTERDGRKIRLLVIVPGAREKLDDVGTHEDSSHIAIAIRPISASDIRYAVIGFSLE